MTDFLVLGLGLECSELDLESAIGDYVVRLSCDWSRRYYIIFILAHFGTDVTSIGISYGATKSVICAALKYIGYIACGLKPPAYGLVKLIIK